jgi:hypothetical protein
MKIYQFDGEWYCKPCGEAIAATLPEPDAWEREHPDSCSHPVAYDSSEGESDTPDHCGTPDCQLFLERNLTEDGIEYVRHAMRELALGYGRDEIVQLWAEFYDVAEATSGLRARRG